MFFSSSFIHVYANLVSEEMLLHEQVDAIPSDFVRLSPAQPDTNIILRINLVQNDLAGLKRSLNDASVPSSPHYGQWLSKEQVIDFARPSNTTSTLVNQWLTQNGIHPSPISPVGDWISFPIAVGQANRMLAADFAVYAHKPTGEQYVRTLAYSIPASLRNHIRVVHPTTFTSSRSFGGPMHSSPMVSVSKVPGASAVNTTEAPTACGDTMTPNCLQSLYELPSKPATNATNSLLVTGFLRQFANKNDISQFISMARPDIGLPWGAEFFERFIDGGVNSQYPYQAGLEAAVDIQYTLGLATNVPVTFMSVGSNYKDNDNGFMDVVESLMADDNPPKVVTTSYGFASEAAVPENLASALCDAYAMLAARGVSIMFSSGDGGVAATPGNRCYSTFAPVFPSCPYITLVGATQGIPETAATFSAGGFSNLFPQESWQTNAVNEYLSQIGNQYNGRFNRAGRGYPDVSTAGYNVEIFHQGRVKTVSGTSCSSPIFAAVIALLNDELLNAGKPVLGFLNPWLYANPHAFNDIQTGNNPGCGTPGFFAKRGWDPISGLGTPNYARMRVAAGLS
ncbi:subtilisin-like protein [Mycena rebaudengoi]|nr:subtilisin-like protein [Mycena rebaudengoi]